MSKHTMSTIAFVAGGAWWVAELVSESGVATAESGLSSAADFGAKLKDFDANVPLGNSAGGFALFPLIPTTSGWLFAIGAILRWGFHK